MPDWDEDSPQLRTNLTHVLSAISLAARERETPTAEQARRWHILMMDGLTVPERRYVGAFRGEAGLEAVRIKVGANDGVEPKYVSEHLAGFESRLQGLVAELDVLLPADREPDADQLEAILDLCAWVHAEWVRIHPFANGNGRTARLWANSLAMRYSLPPFIRLRPRPDGGYRSAGIWAMQGDWQPTAIVFRRLLDNFLAGYQPCPSNT